MTEIIYYAAISLDGFIAKTDGNVDWLNKYLATGGNPSGVVQLKYRKK